MNLKVCLMTSFFCSTISSLKLIFLIYYFVLLLQDFLYVIILILGDDITCLRKRKQMN